MKREHTRGAYQEFSGKLSDVVRQLSFAGIALIWVFKVDRPDGAAQIPASLLWPAALIVMALASDFAQYIYASAAWGVYNRVLEKRGVGENAQFSAPAWINWPSIFFFWFKVALVAAAYVSFLRYLRQTIAAA